MKFAGIIAALIAIACLVGSDLADAKRLGGGRSLGAQRQSTAPAPATPPSAAPSTPAGAASQPVMPAQPGAAAAKAASPAAAAASPSGMSRWMGPLAGLAAGLGLAALLSHFGLSEGFASLLLMGLLVVGVVLVVRMFLARRNPVKPAMQYAGPSGLDTKPGGYETQPAPILAREAQVEPVLAGSTPVPSASFARPLPEGFDATAFVAQAKLQFNRLQAAFDRGDRKMMADVLTPAMLTEVVRDLDTRGEHRPTEVVTLHAEVLEVKTEHRDYWASVRFTGTLREDGTALSTSIDEIWNLTKPVDGSAGWLLAGIEQVQTA